MLLNLTNNIVLEQAFLKHIEIPIENAEQKCWVWRGSINTKKYGVVFCKDQYFGLAHRLSYILYKGIIPEKMLVCHTCDRRRCVNPAHLFLGTAKQNTQDCISKNRFGLGDTHHSTTISEEQIKEIFIMRKNGLTQLQIAQKFNSSQGYISTILNKKVRRK